MKYDEILKVSGELLAAAQTLPASATSEDGNGAGQELSGTKGAIEVIVVVNTQITIPTTKTLTVALQDSADNSSFAALDTVVARTAGGTNDVVAAGTILGRVIIKESARRYVKAVITADATGFLGKIDVIPAYLAR